MRPLPVGRPDDTDVHRIQPHAPLLALKASLSGKVECSQPGWASGMSMASSAWLNSCPPEAALCASEAAE